MTITEPIDTKRVNRFLTVYSIFSLITSLGFLSYYIIKAIGHGLNQDNIFFITVTIIALILANLPKNKILTKISQDVLRILSIVIVFYSINLLIHVGTGWDLLFVAAFLTIYIISSRNEIEDNPLRIKNLF